MPSELVRCPECQRKLRVPEDLIGKQVKCPTCGHTFTADPASQAPPPPPPAAVEEKPTRTSKVNRDDKDDDDDDEERSRHKRLRSRRDDDDDDDDRPRRRSRSSRDDDDEDDDEDRPRRRRGRDYLPHRGGAVLTMGILSLALIPLHIPFAGLILGIIAWVMGNTDLAEMRAGRMDPEGESQTNAGRVCGMVTVILHIVLLVVGAAIFFCFGAGIMGAAGGAGRHSRGAGPETLSREAVMPEVVSCPKCQRKSRVPDNLLGKKVKCPGCAEIFTANVNGAAPPKPAPKKEDAPAKKKAEKEEDGDTYEVVDDKKKSKRRRADDDDDDDERVADKPISRRRAAADDDDDDDKPRKSRTSRDDDDDDDDDDDRVSSRRRRFSRDDDDDDDDDDDREERRPRRSAGPSADWTRVRMGLTLLLASVLTAIGLIVFMFLGGCCLGAGMMGVAGNAAAGGGRGAAGGIAGLGAGFIVLMGIYLLGAFAVWALKVGGAIMCLPSPVPFGSKMLALVSLILIGAETAFSLLQFVLNLVANGAAGIMAGAGNPMVGMAPAGAAAGQMVLGLLSTLCYFVWLFVIGFYIRSLGLCMRNYSLAGTAKGWLITLGITIGLTILMFLVAIGTVGMVGMNIANQMGPGRGQGPGAAGGAAAGGVTVLCGLGLILLIMSLVLLVWYIVMLAQARGSITGRMTR